MCMFGWIRGALVMDRWADEAGMNDVEGKPCAASIPAAANRRQENTRNKPTICNSLQGGPSNEGLSRLHRDQKESSGLTDVIRGRRDA